MDKFALRANDDRSAFINESSARRDLTPIIIEKDFWVCWTLRRLAAHPALVGHITFKGGTSLSKAYGIIQRFSEDIDLTIRRTAPFLADTQSPMDADISGNERQRRVKALKAAAQDFVHKLVIPTLTEAITTSLGTDKGWSLVPDEDDPEAQSLIFNYPRIGGWGSDWGSRWGDPEDGYIKPRIKLEFGARGEPEPFESRPIRPYLADDFPDELPDADTAVETLSVVRTFWEKATILHALFHNGKMKPGLSRHYYDLIMLDGAGIADAALDRPDLLASVVANKSLMFTDKSASYETATRGSFHLSPSPAIAEEFAADYAAMTDMFMIAPPALTDLLDRLAALEARINAATDVASTGAA